MFVDMEVCRRLLDATSADALVRMDKETTPAPFRDAIVRVCEVPESQVFWGGPATYHLHELMGVQMLVVNTNTSNDWCFVFHKNAFTPIDR